MQASLVTKSEEKKKTASPRTEGEFNVQPIQEETSASTGLPLFLRRGVQTKLAAGAADDPLDGEGDSVTQSVVRAGAFSGASHVSAGRIQRKCAGCSDSHKCSACRQ